MLLRTAAQPLAEQLAERFASRIRDRLLAAGARLPSVRQCAAQHGVSPSTVVAAYDQLLAQGLVEARRQRGFYVRDIGQKTPPALAGQAQAATENIVFQARRKATRGVQSVTSTGNDPSSAAPPAPVTSPSRIQLQPPLS